MNGLQRRASKSILRALVLLGAGAMAGPGAALIYTPVSDGVLLDQAEVVVVADVAPVGPRLAAGGVVTEYTAAVVEVIKGDPRLASLLVAVPGGELADLGIQLHFFGAPDLSTHRKWLLFLDYDAEAAAYRILHLNQGAFFQGSSRQNPAEYGRWIDLDEHSRDGVRFPLWLRDRAAGRHRDPDYKRGAMPSPLGEFLFLLNQRRHRWFEFDTGKAVRWKRHEGGQEALPGGGRAALRRALAIWKKKNSGAPVRLRLRGTTSSTVGHRRADGFNTVLYGDLSNAIDRDFSCATGGVIATATLTSFDATPRFFKGFPFRPAQEADIVINAGVDCLFRGRPDIATYVYAHELGHTLGLGHACGDPPGPSCEAAPLLSEALMGARLPMEPEPRLGRDDILGIRFLYHPEFWAAPCHLAPGARAFCKRCGPCGEGQGHCRRDNQCAEGLQCEPNRGGEFGLDPDTAVCAPPSAPGLGIR